MSLSGDLIFFDETNRLRLILYFVYRSNSTSFLCRFKIYLILFIIYNLCEAKLKV